jgi:TRAP-type mannitol/chloroaromatic compound transport system substrate-binding protein
MQGDVKGKPRALSYDAVSKINLDYNTSPHPGRTPPCDGLFNRALSWPIRRYINMDRRSLIKNAGIAGVLAAGVAPAVHAQAAVRWRLSSSFPKALDTIFGAAEVFAKSVKAMSGGKFEISVHAGGEITPPFGVVDAVQQGSVDMCHTAPYYFFGKNEAFALGCAIPFGLNSRQMSAWMYEGNGLKLMREFYAK